jgi:monoterpene epsilon-lactone hydrolase
VASPELDKLVSLLRTAKISTDPNIEEIRAGWEKFAASFIPAADLSFKPVVARGVAAEWVTAPDSDPSRVVLYFHGGIHDWLDCELP